MFYINIADSKYNSLIDMNYVGRLIFVPSIVSYIDYHGHDCLYMHYIRHCVKLQRAAMTKNYTAKTKRECILRDFNSAVPRPVHNQFRIAVPQ